MQSELYETIILPYEFDMERIESLNPIDRQAYNQSLLLIWLVANKYTSYENATELLGMHEKSVYRLVKRMEKTGYIQLFNNDSYAKKLIAPTTKGVRYLEENGNILKNSHKVHFKRLLTIGNTKHSLGVQRSLITTLKIKNDSSFNDCIELAIEPKVNRINPDAILISNQTMAIEYERSKKSKGRAMFQIQSHLRNLENNHYQKVAYFFEDKGIADFYMNKFREDKWGQYIKKENGNCKKTGSFMKNEELLERLKFYYFDEFGSITETSLKLYPMRIFEESNTGIVFKYVVHESSISRENDRLIHEALGYYVEYV